MNLLMLMKECKLNLIQFLINESLSKTLNIKTNEIVKIQDQEFLVIGKVRSVPDVSGFVTFGDWVLTGKQTLDILKLNGIGNFLNL